MSEWNEQSTDEKKYVDVMIYFTIQLTTINHFEVIGWGVSKYKSFESVNAVAKI